MSRLQLSRRAAIAPLTALMLIPLMGMLAFAIDWGYVVVIQSDLQSAADAAALAGAGPLMDGYVLYNLPNQTSMQQTVVLNQAKAAAAAAAIQYASYNSAGVQSLTLNQSDIEFGFTDANGNYSNNSDNFPNTIKVTLRRDGTANGPLGLFFGPAIGTSSTNLSASAAATIYEATVSSFNPVRNFNLNILPMTYDINNWNNFLKTGQNPDGITTADDNGNPTLKLYPSIKDTGNFGLFSLNDNTNGASTISDWISSGMQQDDVQSLLNASSKAQVPLVPLDSHNSANNGTFITPSASNDGLGSWNWSGNPGIKQSDIWTLSNYVGNTYLIPLFVPLDSNPLTYTAGNGTGSHYYFNMVQFVSIKIVSTGTQAVIVQPAPTVLDYTQVMFSTTNPPVPAGSGPTTSATTFAPPKLTQ
jgi:Flp pilus assembly protein TadG